MSGIEAIGVLASIGQLLEFGLKITSLINDVYNRVKDAPEKVLLHTAHIKQLVETACLIQEESELQNPLVHSHVRATLQEAEKLQRILERMVVDYTKGSGKKRLWKTLVGREERRMIASFDRLEKEKSALILCISFTHTETLGIIRDSVGELIPRINSMDQGVNAINRRFRRANKHRSHGVSGQLMFSPLQ
ncbi:hypothetical protein LAWI1_G006406 [Lachnellula willkommii]|uniref:NACHT-NTPase and P-loop NTPases N-terminal domain-containing protein n=1 Tax=Lachnellula willkommii TaxID=215461 RepID=A0A559M485_9HELO|nr:hypothetical protein LAWI1_G006406 [Lachnellula willkommii]